MNTKVMAPKIPPHLQGSWAALQRAALRARALAAQTDTALVVSHNGVLEHIYPAREAGHAPAPAPRPDKDAP